MTTPTDDFETLITGIAENRLNLHGEPGQSFIKQAVDEVDPEAFADALWARLSEASGFKRTMLPAYGALAGIASYWRGMLAFSPKTHPWDAPPALVLAVRKACLGMLLDDPYFLDDVRGGQPAFAMELAVLAAAQKDEIYEQVEAKLREMVGEDSEAARDAQYSLQSLHYG